MRSTACAPRKTPANAAWWRGAALLAMQEAQSRGSLPILCGGTGLYFSTLTHAWRTFPILARRHGQRRGRGSPISGPKPCTPSCPGSTPASAARLRPTDSQRVARAWEVLRGTGRGLAEWQSAPALPPAPWRFRAIRLDPPRAELRAAIALRFAAMLRDGALGEVRALVSLGLDPALPAMRAHGVPELAAHLRGELTLAEAATRAEQVTAQYTKRQATWFRHHMLAPISDTRVIIAPNYLG
ncbi:MAG: tRNA dimethylallyltransferase [Rhodospirillales bacterium]